jgi:hypothetical protein
MRVCVDVDDHRRAVAAADCCTQFDKLFVCNAFIRSSRIVLERPSPARGVLGWMNALARAFGWEGAPSRVEVDI